MALAFPLPMGKFLKLLNVEDMTFHAPPQTEVSQTAAGEMLSRQLAPTLWRGSVTLRNLRYGCGAGRAALLAAVSEPGASFMIYNKMHWAPRDDPDATKLGAAAPVLTFVNAAGDVQIDGLPPGYQIKAGDYFSFSYGTNPVRYALHQFVKDGTANTGTNPGCLGGMAVHPRIRPGWVASTPVRLVWPVCKAVIVPGSLSEAAYGPVAMSGLSFRWQQTLR